MFHHFSWIFKISVIVFLLSMSSFLSLACSICINILRCSSCNISIYLFLRWLIIISLQFLLLPVLLLLPQISFFSCFFWLFISSVIGFMQMSNVAWLSIYIFQQNTKWFNRSFMCIFGVHTLVRLTLRWWDGKMARSSSRSNICICWSSFWGSLWLSTKSISNILSGKGYIKGQD